MCARACLFVCVCVRLCVYVCLCVFVSGCRIYIPHGFTRPMSPEHSSHLSPVQRHKLIGYYQ